MESTRIENLPPPPGIIASLKAGFDSVAAHITAILLPVLLDMFLWLGPRLHLDTLFTLIRGDMISIWKASGISETDIQAALSMYETNIPQINLFNLLRTFPIGFSGFLYPLQKFPFEVFNLIFPPAALRTPLGTPAILQVTPLNLLGWVFLLTLIGWIGGGLYFRSVAWASVMSQDTPIPTPSRAVVQTFLLSMVWFVICGVVGFPFLVLLALILQANESIGFIIVLLLSLMSMWVIVPLFFWPHGIFVKSQNFLLSMISSIQLTRFTLPTSSMFVLMIFLLTAGLNYLWSIPPEDSWMTLLGIFGHAFVTTGLQKVIEKLKPGPLKQAS